jgi:hypothetical protein
MNVFGIMNSRDSIKGGEGNDWGHS